VEPALVVDRLGSRLGAVPVALHHVVSADHDLAHLAVAEASHNRVLVVQLISLEHVSWPRRNVTATPKLARHIFDIHTKLTDLIELRDAAGARALMDDHVKMIRARRVAERDHGHETTCC